MSEEKNTNKLKENENTPHIKPGDIEGKIEVPDTRERRDGPGGN